MGSSHLVGGVDRRFGQLGIIKVLEFVDSSGSFDNT